jgi:protein-L-isoaspartate(D-aspartate) O-methyltransferase
VGRRATADHEADAEALARMVRDQIASRGVRDALTLAAMRLVPRARFVPPQLRSSAYADGALSIGHGQTISQPYIVARMTELLDLGRWSAEHPDRPLLVLDVGTGSGYQAAVLAQLGASVVSIERDERLAAEARERLASLGYRVEVIVGDGSEGYRERAPYAGIVVGAAAPGIPEPLVEQLDDGARLVIPVGPRDTQRLTVVERTSTGVRTSHADACVFVPLVGAHGHRA